MRVWDRGAAWQPDRVAETGEGMLDDASGLSATPVWRHERITGSPAGAAERVAGFIQEAGDRPVIAAAARHSMGGQSIARDGLNLTVAQDFLEVTGPDSYRVGAGTRWARVIAELDAQGCSPAVMQSNNDFGVAATFSVNAHGWPVPFSGCGATVRSLELIGPDGRRMTCSRGENAEIFGATMGGYGLFGIITELELDMVPNQLLEPEYRLLPANDFGPAFRDVLYDDPAVSMAYGRLDVSHARFFDEALMITYRPTPEQVELPPVQGSGWLSRASRPLFRAQLENERIKGLRWWLETVAAPRLGGPVTRNALLNEPVVTLDDRDPDRTDILHEYFLPSDRFADFLSVCRRVIPASYQQLLNVTLRYVQADTESLLAYAPQDRIAAVMLFSQERTERAEADMQRMTRQLIDGALAAGGSYYLPYRLHATQGQFDAAYPRAIEFARLKRDFDPQGRFSNALWRRYMEHLA
ncbi:FAD-binding oxidoreductase [Sulfitobacter sp. D35]|uniref:FAD-binding oxidoreductase n=1 Tax=Sulfitobacter sp. D35 TaxID=3083252 RepID=UPI00296FD250|nr:FAD-binding oxidoreductase [Sulfitobacter sp. D35]MDW4497037.1 FAD-binding oxidoreductase [Sulfitobacter sp. D35]